ncbi:MAG: flagellar basal-body rod protein FlgF [Desulfovibrionaceae bacterium]|nr:flagellar basal-body rod protein FlgF [Desulfovibrionaceae bacterium]
MQQSMYSALFGALTNEHRMNNIANNLANVNTSGYKRDVLAFQDTFAKFAHDMVMEPILSVRSEKLFPEPQHLAKTRIATSKTDFSQGSMKFTGNPLDVAIAGDGFFKINSNGEELFTRSGHFVLNNEGMLVTPNGHPVLGAGGAEITIPAGTGRITIGVDGSIYADEDMVGQLQVSTVDDLTALQKVGHSAYRLRANAEAVEEGAANFSVEQGYLESANVQVVYEMVNMIEAHRQFDAYQKVMQTTDTLDRDAVSKVGKARV